MEGVLLGVWGTLGLWALMPHSLKGEGVDPAGDGPACGELLCMSRLSLSWRGPDREGVPSGGLLALQTHMN